jgi:hypothetical protein
MSYHRDFVPEGCSLAQPAATLGVSLHIFRKFTGLLIRGTSSRCQAGVQWAEAYEFADAHNITLVGGALVCPPLAVGPQDNNFTAGSDRTVGVVGGWLQVKLYVSDVAYFMLISCPRTRAAGTACSATPWVLELTEW